MESIMRHQEGLQHELLESKAKAQDNEIFGTQMKDKAEEIEELRTSNAENDMQARQTKKWKKNADTRHVPAKKNVNRNLPQSAEAT